MTYVDSAGLQMLFVLATRLRRLQIQLRVLARTGTPAQRVIELSGMSELLGVDANKITACRRLIRVVAVAAPGKVETREHRDLQGRQ